MAEPPSAWSRVIASAVDPSHRKSATMRPRRDEHPSRVPPAPQRTCDPLLCSGWGHELRGVTADLAGLGCWRRAPGRGACGGCCRGVGLVVLLRAGRVASWALSARLLSLRAELPGAAESGAVDRSVGGLRPPARAARVAGRLDPVKKL